MTRPQYLPDRSSNLQNQGPAEKQHKNKAPVLAAVTLQQEASISLKKTLLANLLV
jgi:hypothetical protein